MLSGTETWNAAVSLVAFAVVSVGAVFVAMRGRPGHLRRQLGRTLRSSGQLYIRLALGLIALMTFLAAELSLDFLLGAFMAGIVYRLYVSAGAPSHEIETMESKLEADLGDRVPAHRHPARVLNCTSAGPASGEQCSIGLGQAE